MKSLFLIIGLVCGLLAAAFAMLSVKIIFRKNGRFSSMHISDSKPMRDRGITCVQSMDRRERRAAEKKINVKEL